MSVTKEIVNVGFVALSHAPCEPNILLMDGIDLSAYFHFHHSPRSL